MTNPAGRRLILMTMWQVSSASYVGSIRSMSPGPLAKGLVRTDEFSTG